MSKGFLKDPTARMRRRQAWDIAAREGVRSIDFERTCCIVTVLNKGETTMQIKASNLRKDIYRLLDRVLATGEPLEIERNGQFLKVVPERQRGSKLAKLVPHNCITGDAEELVHMDWSSEWNEA